MNKKNNTFLRGLASRLSAAVLLLVVGSVAALAGENKLWIDGFQIKPGDTKTVYVMLDNEDPVSSLQFDVVLPAGLSYVYDKSYTDGLTKADRMANHFFMCNRLSDAYRIAVLTNYSVSKENSALTGNSGAVLSFDVKAANNFVGGEIELKNIVGSNATVAEPVELLIPSMKATVDAYAGDFVAEASEISAKAGDIVPVGLVLKNLVNIVALELDFTLPEGFTLATDENGGAITRTDRLTANMQVDVKADAANPNLYKLLLASLTNDPVSGNDGVLFYLNVAVPENFSQAGQIVFDNVLGAVRDAGRDYKLFVSSDKEEYPVVTINPHVDFVIDGVTPAIDEPIASLSKIEFNMNVDVTSLAEDAKVGVYDVAGEKVGEGTLALVDGVLTATFATPIDVYGTYNVVIPEGVLLSNGVSNTEALSVQYNVGLFEVASVTPEAGTTLESLSEIKLNMTVPVGGILDGATLTVKRNGEDAVPATLSVSEDDATEVVITLGAEQTEYGLYTIEIPAGTIFDEKYDELDPTMSGARGNDLIALSYQVGEFNVETVDPLPGTPLDSLTKVTVFMSAPVGGFLEGATVDVMKNGDKVAEAVLDWATEIGGNDVAVILPHAVADYGTYTIVVPAGVIFDVNYSGDDAAFNGAQSNEAFELTYKVGEFKVADIVPAPGDEPVESLKDIEIFMNARVGGFLDGATVNVLKNGDVVAEGTLDWATEPYGNDVVVRLNTELTEYGTYAVEIPAGVIFDENYDAEDPAMSGASSNDEMTLVYQVGKFELVSTNPVQTEAQLSLKDIELFMSARVGGFEEGATVTVTRNGSEITTGTLDWATEPLGNDVVIRLADEITEFGVYEVVIPAGAIYDENYDEVDPVFSGAKSNEEIKLTYTIGLSLGDFVPVSITPSINSTVESLSEIEIEMSSKVGGFLIGSPVVVTNEKGVEVARGSFDWAENTNGAELVIRLDNVIEEAGTYKVAVPAAVIYDEKYDVNDPFIPDVKHNEAFTLTYTVIDASGIDGVKMDINSNDKVYNLNGVRVNGPIGKGLYIINGKKVVNKR